MCQRNSILLIAVLTATLGCQEADDSGATQTNQVGNQAASSDGSGDGDVSDDATNSNDQSGADVTGEDNNADDESQTASTASSSDSTTSESSDAGVGQTGDDAGTEDGQSTTQSDEPDLDVGETAADAGEPTESIADGDGSNDNGSNDDEPSDAGVVPEEEEPEALPGAGTPTCAGRRARLLECGLLSEGDYLCSEPETDQEVCNFECLLVASCNILKTYECNAQATSPLQSCFSACTELVEPFLCVDEALEIDGNWVCDGKQDCLDGSDEADCAASMFECDSEDQQIPIANECDGLAQCTDGSDEDGCPTFTCLATEVEIPERWLCDGAEDCLDGSDEAGCARPICE